MWPDDLKVEIETSDGKVHTRSMSHRTWISDFFTHAVYLLRNEPENYTVKDIVAVTVPNRQQISDKKIKIELKLNDFQLMYTSSYDTLNTSLLLLQRLQLLKQQRMFDNGTH